MTLSLGVAAGSSPAPASSKRVIVLFKRFVCCFFFSVFLLSFPVLAYDYSDTVFGVTFYLHSEGIGTTSRDTVYRINSRAITDEQSQYVASGLYYVAAGAEKAIDAASISQSDITHILNSLDRMESYLSRIDVATDGLEGRLQNIYAELNTYHRPLLTSINTSLSALNSGLFSSAWSFAWFYPVFNSDGSISMSTSGVSSTGLLSLISTGFTYLLSTVSRVPFVLQPAISRLLVGEDGSAVFSFLSPGQDGGLEASEQEVNNLLDALALLGTSLQNPLAKLQYVLADDDDIALKDANKPNEDAFKDNFTGDGDSAVKPSDIGELAGVSSSVKDTFAGAGSPADIFSVLNDSGSFGFFSQEVADILEPPVPAAVSDEPFDVDALMEEDSEFWGQFDIDDEGFCTPKFSLFDAESYLEGLE